MSKISYLRRRLAEQFNNDDFEAAAETGEVLLREHWHNRNFQTESYADDLYNTARVHDELCNFERAAELYSDSANQIMQVDGEREPFAMRLNELGTVLCEMDMLEPAYFVLMQAAHVRMMHVGNEDPRYGETIYNLAQVVSKGGRLRDALRYHRDALKVFEKVGCSDRIITSLHSIAFIYETLEEYEKAISYAKKAMTIATNEDEETYAGACNYLAGLYESCKKFEEALPLYERVLEAAKQHVGCENSTYLNIAYRRANLLARLNRREEALESHEEVRGIFGRMMGTNHIFYANCLRNMALLNKSLGNPNAAESLMLESIKIRRTASDEISDDIVFLINLYLHENKTDKAMEALIYALMCAEGNTDSFSKLLNTLAATFSQPDLPNTSSFIDAIRDLDDRTKLRPIINKWTDWET